jgi:predicted SnoaL-like aldol condensation-catalyzing enzyme
VAATVVSYGASTIGSEAHAVPHGAACPLAVEKGVVRQFIDLSVNRAHPGLAAQLFVGPTYTEHDPRMPDGKQGFVTQTRQTERANPDLHQDIVRVVAEGDQVFVQSHVTTEPRQRGNDLAGAVTGDLYRLANCRIVEHWNVTQPDPGSNGLPGNTMLSGPDVNPVADNSTARRDANWQPVAHYLYDCVNGLHDPTLDLYACVRGSMTPDFIDHDPPAAQTQGADGDAAGLLQLRAGNPPIDSYFTVHQVIRERDFVVTYSQLSVTPDQRGSVAQGIARFNIWRLTPGAHPMVAEHWSVYEFIPPTSSNDNTMF